MSGLIQPPPSQGHSRGRLTAAQRMLDRASTVISSLENSDGQTASSEGEPQDPPSASTPTPSGAQDEGDCNLPAF